MKQAKVVHVIVTRTIHSKDGTNQWQPVGYAESLEEADAVLNQLLEAERAQLHSQDRGLEKEYAVWPVPEAWSILEG